MSGRDTPAAILLSFNYIKYCYLYRLSTTEMFVKKAKKSLNSRSAGQNKYMQNKKKFELIFPSFRPFLSVLHSSRDGTGERRAYVGKGGKGGGIPLG